MNWVERPACSDGPLRALVRTLELAVVPGHDAVGAYPHAEALRPALVDERADLVGDLTEVPGVDRLADGHDLVVISHDGAAAHDLDAPQLGVLLAALHQAGDSWRPLEVADLLALAEGPEHRIAVEHGVPQGHEVDRAVVDRRGDVPWVSSEARKSTGHGKT